VPKKNGREKCKKLEQVAQVCRELAAVCRELAAVCPELVAMCHELAARRYARPQARGPLGHKLAAVCPELVAMCHELVARRYARPQARGSLRQCAASSRQERVPRARGKSVCRELAAVCRKLAARACTASSRQCAASSRPCLPLARGLCHNLEAPLSFSSQAEPKFHSAGATCQYRAPLKITPYKYPATTQ